jgi:hypothetical protein
MSGARQSPHVVRVGRGNPLEDQARQKTRKILERPPALQDTAAPISGGSRHPSQGGGSRLSIGERAFFEPRFGHDFGNVRVHTDARSERSAADLGAHAFTLGSDIFFGAGRYAPATAAGRQLLAHELSHVVQQARLSSPRIQAFTADLQDDRVVLIPERGDTDADLNRVLCPAINDRKIGTREKIDITDCFPKGTIPAMGLGPYNCSQFVGTALAGKAPAAPADPKFAEELLTTRLWSELLGKGYRVGSIASLERGGKVVPATGLSWKQTRPRAGDVVFMSGGIGLARGVEPSPTADNFNVTWDHVGFFIVRSRSGQDYHLAKDGDEKSIAVYHTGAILEEWETAGAYVKGTETLLAYLTIPQLDDPTRQRARIIDITQKRRADLDVDVTISFELHGVAGKPLPKDLEIEVLEEGGGIVLEGSEPKTEKLVRSSIASREGKGIWVWRAQHPGWRSYRVQIWSASEAAVLGSKVFETNPKCVLGVSTMHCE